MSHNFLSHERSFSNPAISNSLRRTNVHVMVKVVVYCRLNSKRCVLQSPSVPHIMLNLSSFAHAYSGYVKRETFLFLSCVSLAVSRASAPESD